MPALNISPNMGHSKPSLITLVGHNSMHNLFYYLQVVFFPESEKNKCHFLVVSQTVSSVINLLGILRAKWKRGDTDGVFYIMSLC